MKKGCLIYILLFIGACLLEWAALKQFRPDIAEPVAIPLGLLILACLANLHGILSALKQKRLLSRDPSEWKEGDLVGVSGRLSALKSALVAPASGRSVTLYEYDVKRTVISGSGKNKSTSTISDYMGFGMAPCAIRTRRGSVRLIGFPMLAHFKEKILSEVVEYERMYDHLASSQLTPRAKGLKGALGQINEVLKDQDGEVRLDLRDPSAITDAPVKRAVRHEALPSAIDTESEDLQESQRSGAESHDEEDSGYPDLSPTVSWFTATGYSIHETSVENGAEITAFGTYHANPQRLDVGGILDTFSHALFPGEGSAVVSKNMLKSAITFMVFTAIAITVHYYLYPDLGRVISEAITQMS